MVIPVSAGSINYSHIFELSFVIGDIKDEIYIDDLPWTN